MGEDVYTWEPLPAAKVAELLSGLKVPWWIAGGCAIDLFVGRQTRSHGDTDVLIQREDQLEVQAHLSDWDLHRANYPGLVPWKEGEYLKGLHGMDVSAILQMVKEGAEGKLVDVNVDGEDGEKVKVEVIVD